MALTLKVATDLYRSKINYIVDFPSVPSLHALKVKMEALFTREVEAKRPAGAPSTVFRIDHIQIFEAKSGSWVELDNTALLHEGCQLYVFQPPSEWHNDAQGGLPPATRPPAIIDRFHPSPLRAPLVPPPMVPPPHMATEAVAHSAVALGDLVESAHHARAATLAAETEVVETSKFLAAQEAKTIGATRQAEVSMLHLTDAQRKACCAREQYTAAMNGVEAVKSSERNAVLEHSRLVDEVHIAETRCQAQETDLARAQHRLTEIARLVAQQKIEADHHRDLAIRCTVDLETAQTKVAQQEAALEASRSGVEECVKQLEEAKADVATAEAKLAETDATFEAKREATTAAKTNVTSAMTAFSAAKEVEAMRRQEQVEAQYQVGIAQTRAMVQDEETAKIELKLKEVESLLKMQQLEVDRHKELSNRCHQELEDARAKEESSCAEALEAQRAVHTAEDELMKAERELEGALIAEREAQSQQVLSQSEVDRARACVAGREAALERAREREQLVSAALDDAKVEVTQTEVRKTTQDAELAATEERLVELERLHAEQMMEVERTREQATDARGRLLAASDTEKQTAAEVALIQTMVNTTHDELLRKQAELAAYQDLENEAAAAKMQAEGERAAQLTLMSATEKQLFTLREKEGIRRAAEEETIRAADLQSRLTRSLEREQVDLAARRLALEQELSPHHMHRRASPRHMY